jgi:hypothetical protein
MRVSGFLRGAAAAFLLSACAGPLSAQPQPVPKPDVRALDAGALQGAQPAKLAEAVAGIRPGVPGETELFAVLAAWYPDQRVFLREVEQAGAILADRFDAQGRVVTLVSSLAHPLRHPLATPASLSAATRAVAAKMNPEDVLMVYLTSHGLHGMLAGGDGALRTPPLTAQALDRILDEAGAPRTVAVISACRSGSFVPAVRAPDRLVITAAAADRNSFGCSDANEWTWFGKAFFDEALRETRSLPHAFARAAALVAEWEGEVDEIPSQPQMAKGAEIGRALEELAQDAGS